MIDPNEVRIQIRAVLSAIPRDRRLSEEYILAALQRFFPVTVNVREMLAALQWNEARGWAAKFRNADFARDEWQLTPEGWVKEGL